MAISVVGSTVKLSGASLSVPAGVLNGDLLIAFAGHTGSTTVPTLPTGWTQIDTTGANAPASLTCWRVAASEPASYTFTNMNDGVMIALRGQDTTTPINGHSMLRTTSGTTLNSTAVTTTVANCQIIWAAITNLGTVTAIPTGYNSDQGVGNAIALADIAQPSAGSTGAVTGTESGANTATVSLIAVAPLAGSSPPSNTVAPAVTGTATVGSTLTTTNGTWTDNGSPVFTYQWQRDAAGNGVYSNIASATSSTYTLVSADDTCHVRCVVTDTDALSLSGSANSNATAIVTFAVPVNSVAPVVSGNTVVGSVLSTTNGTWSNSPTSFGYQWTRDGVNISAATNSTYTSVSADATHAVGCTVTATNDGGTASGVASSNTISVVTAPSLSTVAGKTGTSGTAVMQKAKSGWTYITGKTGTSGTAVDQKGAGSFTKIKGH